MNYSTQLLGEDEVMCLVSHAEITAFENYELFSDLFPSCNYDAIMKYRRSPRRFFSHLTIRTDDLLELMMSTDTVLLGPRAANYFISESATQHSTWIFCCASNYYSSMIFIDGMIKLGMIMNSHAEVYYDVDESDRYTIPYDYRQYVRILHGKMSKHNVRIILVKHRDSAFGLMIRFRTSAEQCMITAGYAISLFHSSNKKSELIDWTQSNDWGTIYDTCSEQVCMVSFADQYGMISDMKSCSNYTVGKLRNMFWSVNPSTVNQLRKDSSGYTNLPTAVSPYMYMRLTRLLASGIVDQITSETRLDPYEYIYEQIIRIPEVKKEFLDNIRTVTNIWMNDNIYNIESDIYVWNKQCISSIFRWPEESDMEQCITSRFKTLAYSIENPGDHCITIIRFCLM